MSLWSILYRDYICVQIVICPDDGNWMVTEMLKKNCWTWLVYQTNKNIDTILQNFYTEVQKADGGKYKLEHLRIIIATLGRHLRNIRATFRIIKDWQFKDSWKARMGKPLNNVKRGKEKSRKEPTHTHPEEQLSTKNVLWGEDLVSLNCTIFYIAS